MIIDIAEAVCKEGELFFAKFNKPFASIEYLEEYYQFDSGVNVEASWRCDGVKINVTGSFDADVKVRCARCLDSFLYSLCFEFDEHFSKQPQEGMYEFGGDIIDLSQMIEDNIIINLPTRFLCNESCKGLCSHCGVNLNEGDCNGI